MLGPEMGVSTLTYGKQPVTQLSSSVTKHPRKTDSEKKWLFWPSASKISFCLAIFEVRGEAEILQLKVVTMEKSCPILVSQEVGGKYQGQESPFKCKVLQGPSCKQIFEEAIQYRCTDEVVPSLSSHLSTAPPSGD